MDLETTIDNGERVLLQLPWHMEPAYKNSSYPFWESCRLVGILDARHLQRLALGCARLVKADRQARIAHYACNPAGMCGGLAVLCT